MDRQDDHAVLDNEQRTVQDLCCKHCEIKELSLKKEERSSWNYVHGKDNPADLEPKGLKTAEVKVNELFWRGHKRLLCNYQRPEKAEIQEAEDHKEEEKKD